MNTRKPLRQRTETHQQDNQRESILKPGPALGPEVKAKIGQQLRLMHDEVVSQGVPDRFAEILRRLDSPTDGGEKK
jgi:Anti-sigma factor NepR